MKRFAVFCCCLIAFAAVTARAAQGEWVIDERIRMTAGEKLRLSDAALIALAPEGTTCWTSQPAEILAVDSRGGITALQTSAPAAAIVTATRGAYGRAYEVIVSPRAGRIRILADGEPIDTRALVFDISEIGRGVLFEAAVEPDGALSRVAWHSDNPGVLRIGEDGSASVKGKGACRITARSLDGSGAEATVYGIVADTEEFPYYLEVDKGNQVVRAYLCGAPDGRLELIRRMVCSTGKHGGLRDGLYSISGAHRAWSGTILPGVYVQYTTCVKGAILFHSIPYAGCNPARIDAAAYGELGTNASHGCVRLLAADAKWVFENVHRGAYALFAAFERDAAEYGAVAWPPLVGTWDPTDDAPENPDYDHAYTSAVG